ncbi:MAG: hypothetical protein ACP5G1_03215, partial [Nanopusillaceae archaeon]
EKIVKTFGNIIKLSSSSKKREKFEKINNELLLDVTIDEIDSAAIVLLILTLTIGLVVSLVFSVSYIIMFILAGVLVYILVDYYYLILYNKLRSKKKSQLIDLLLIIAIKLRQNPNYEQALLYAAKNIRLPLKLDLLRLLRDIYNRKYVSAAEGLLEYARNWKENANFFYVGIMLIESAMHNPDPALRNTQIDKALEDSLEELLIELNLFARELRSSVNIITMLGITLPVLLLTIFPIASIFLSGMFSPLSLFVIFDFALPFVVYIMINYNVASKMLSVFSYGDIMAYYMSKVNVKDKIMIFAISTALFIILFLASAVIIGNIFNNYGLFSIIMSLIFVLIFSLSFSFGSYLYFSHFKQLYKNVREVDNELPAFLLSLSNVLREGYPLEKALIYIYPEYKNSALGRFIVKAYQNLRSGMPFYDSIFDPNKGAIGLVPSDNLRIAMEVIYEGSLLSSEQASVISSIVAKYLVMISKLKERIKDLVADDISQLKNLLRLTAPAILGIITGVSIIIIEVLYKLSIQLNEITQSYGGSIGEYKSYMEGLPQMILDMFNLSGIVSPSTIIIIIGIFNVLIAIAIIYMINSIEDSGDKISLYYRIYKDSIKNSLLYFVFSLMSSVGGYIFVQSVLSVSYLI